MLENSGSWGAGGGGRDRALGHHTCPLQLPGLLQGLLL